MGLVPDSVCEFHDLQFSVRLVSCRIVSTESTSIHPFWNHRPKGLYSGRPILHCQWIWYYKVGVIPYRQEFHPTPTIIVHSRVPKDGSSRVWKKVYYVFLLLLLDPSTDLFRLGWMYGSPTYFNFPYYFQMFCLVSDGNLSDRFGKFIDSCGTESLSFWEFHSVNFHPLGHNYFGGWFTLYTRLSKNRIVRVVFAPARTGSPSFHSDVSSFPDYHIHVRSPPPSGPGCLSRLPQLPSFPPPTGSVTFGLGIFRSLLCFLRSSTALSGLTPVVPTTRVSFPKSKILYVQIVFYFIKKKEFRLTRGLLEPSE